MSVPMVDTATATAIAGSIGFPDASTLGTAGTHVTYNNHYYLLRVDPDSGDYQAWDISVYDPTTGNLETGPSDVYYNAVTGGVSEGVQALTSGATSLLTIGLIAGAIYLLFTFSRNK